MTSHLLTLPFEIRQLIYEHVFANDTVLFLWLGEHKGFENQFKPISTTNRLTEVPQHRGVLTVCRQCHLETYRIQRSSIRHLVIEFEILQKAWPYTDYSVQYMMDEFPRIAYEILSKISRIENIGVILRQLRRLTLPDLFMAGVLEDWMRPLGTDAIQSIEFVSPYGMWKDYSLREGERLIDGVRLRNFHALSRAYFHPTQHSQGTHSLSWFRTVDCVEPKRMRGSWPPVSQILWTADVEWTLLCEGRVEEIEPNWRTPGHRFRDSCLIIQYVSQSAELCREIVARS